MRGKIAVSLEEPLLYNIEIERVYCSNCQKPVRIADDDLESVYSPSDYCICHLKEDYD